MPTFGPDIKARFVPPLDAAMISANAVAITTAGDYPGATLVDLGSTRIGNPGNLGMWFVPSGLTGGTNVKWTLMSDADGTAGSEVTEFTSRVYTTAELEPVCIPLPPLSGRRYWRAQATSTGTYTAGSYTAWIGPIN